MSWIEMRSVFVLVYLIVLRCEAQKERGERPYDNGHGWDIRFAVPGEPGNDYPTLSTIPKTSFTCSKKDPGYYADIETNCQVFRICTLGSTYGFQSFLCPNGTLFNQAVFVCDWWMNVNCKKSTEYFTSNERQSKLKAGQELMTDVKKMLSHPIRNPYEKTIMSENVLVSQEYKPPFKIISPNDNEFIQNEKNIDNFYIHSKPAQNIIGQLQNTYDLSYAASTATPLYIFKSNNLQQDLPRNFQTYATYDSFIVHPTSAQNTDHNIQYNQNTNKQRLISQDTRSLKQQQQQYLNTNEYRNTVGTKQLDLNNELKRHSTQSSNFVKQSTENNYQQKRIFENKNSKEFFSFHKNHTPQSNIVTKQNFLNNNIQPTLITKTLAYRKIIQNPQKGQPKSRITFKTWIVKPSRSPRLVAEPTPYTYNKPSITSENLVSKPTPYTYNKPTTSENLVSEPTPDTYNKPTTSENLVSDTTYIYNKPEYGLISKIIQDNSVATRIIPTTSWSSPFTTVISERQNLISTPRPAIPDRLYLSPIKSIPTKASIVYLPPTTYKPVSLLYLPPPTSSKLRIQENYGIRNQQSQINTNNNNRGNLAFSEYVTKEQLDLKVKDIVTDTNEILKTQRSKQNHLLSENIQINNEAPDRYYLPSQYYQDSDEKVTLQSQLNLPISSRLIAHPSKDLEPPKERIYNNSENFNRLSELPYINESILPKNTIERTVSLKISIPEKIANFIFNNNKMSNSNDLEILNTGSSNYLVLNNKDSDSFVPIGKLKWNKNANLSGSQELVYSFITDSINAAKKYSNIAQQESKPSPSTPAQVQNKDTEDVEQLSDRISQLTSSQYSANSKTTEGQLEKLQQLTPNKQALQYNDDNILFTGNNILSGQLYKYPVPLVTKQIYNAPFKNTLNLQSRQNLIESVPRNEQKNSHLFQQIKSPTKSYITENVGPSSTIITKIDEQNSSDDQKNTFESEYIKDIKKSDNGISAHIHDKTIGTINHPLEDNKLISYEKDKSYFVYTHLNNNIKSNDIPIKEAHVHKDDFNSNHLTHLQYTPNNYENEQALVNNDIRSNYVVSKQNNLEGNVKQNSNRVLDVSANVDYEVDHQSDNEVQKLISEQKLSRLYDGPSSYYAPQMSIGSLRNIGTTDSTYNSRLEDLEKNNNFNGYQREIPSKRFSF